MSMSDIWIRDAVLQRYKKIVTNVAIRSGWELNLNDSPQFATLWAAVDLIAGVNAIPDLAKKHPRFVVGMALLIAIDREPVLSKMLEHERPIYVANLMNTFGMRMCLPFRTWFTSIDSLDLNTAYMENGRHLRQMTPINKKILLGENSKLGTEQLLRYMKANSLR